jgi:Fic family protein
MKYPTHEEMIDYVWHSNRIDYNTIEPKSLTREYVMGKFQYPKGLQDDEISRHVLALMSVIRHAHVRNPSLSGLAQKFHRILMKGLMDKPGHFRDYGVWVGGYGTVNHQDIPTYMKRLDGMLDRAMRTKDAWSIHDEFECIHPFGDGNGRTGRLLMNFVRLRLGFPLLTVTYGRDADQYKYYRKIQEYRDAHFKLL